MGISAARLVFCVGIIGAGIFAVAGAASAAQGPSPTPAVAMHEVTDETGRTIRLPVNPTRIVSLAPSLTEMVYAISAQDRLVGDTDYCDYPPEAQKKPKVGGPMNPSLEQIVALHPDLVLMAKTANRLETVRSLETLGIPSYGSDPHRVDEIISSTQKLAEVLNVGGVGQAVAADLRQRLAALQSKLANVNPTRVLFVVWADPLQSIGKNTFIADALRKAGAVSIVDSSQDWPLVSLEEVARLQPEYLVFANSHSNVPGYDFEALANRPGWRILDAVRNRRFAIMDEAVVRPAPRIVSVIEDLAHQLHPKAFEQTPSAGRQTQLRPVNSPAVVRASCFPELPCAL